MKLDRILPFARLLLEKAVSPGDITIDATAGNGHDTLYLTKLVGEEGHVYAFDIQEQAINKTRAKLEENQSAHLATLFLDSHDQLKNKLPQAENRKLTGAIFNLGYLPGGDKEVVTVAHSTIAAIEQLLELMEIEGIIVLVVYHGHPEGAIERDELMQYVTSLPQEKAHVLHYGFMNQVNSPPFIIAIEKR
ncbi:class I SAM-dependent methyltransferase [Bacillus massiliigorillae]|uniref:class I SAM-dependent methyltransferase n=1 Tax=Bacillus massiliigorillae TaxID=1243664 RepID=UPI00039B81DB|nr:class I SAM-dependent methyltransferase [Bacillus massiliigorillae]